MKRKRRKRRNPPAAFRSFRWNRSSTMTMMTMIRITFSTTHTDISMAVTWTTVTKCISNIPLVDIRMAVCSGHRTIKRNMVETWAKVGFGDVLHLQFPFSAFPHIQSFLIFVLILHVYRKHPLNVNLYKSATASHCKLRALWLTVCESS